MANAEDTYSTGQAAKILRVNERTIRKMLDREELAGELDGAGHWRVLQAAVHARLEEQRQREAQEPPEDTDSVRDLQAKVEDLTYRLGRSEARVELTEKAESTVREERQRLLEDLEHEREERRRLQEELREAHRPFWRRIFGR